MKNEQLCSSFDDPGLKAGSGREDEAELHSDLRFIPSWTDFQQ